MLDPTLVLPRHNPWTLPYLVSGRVRLPVPYERPSLLRTRLRLSVPPEFSKTRPPGWPCPSPPGTYDEELGRGERGLPLRHGTTPKTVDEA